MISYSVINDLNKILPAQVRRIYISPAKEIRLDFFIWTPKKNLLSGENNYTLIFTHVADFQLDCIIGHPLKLIAYHETIGSSSADKDHIFKNYKMIFTDGSLEVVAKNLLLYSS